MAFLLLILTKIIANPLIPAFSLYIVRAPAQDTC
jgi:hypothetical protein